MTNDSFETTIFKSQKLHYNKFHVDGVTTIAHWHNHMEFVVTVEGSCICDINGKAYPCVKGDIIFIPPGHLHSIRCQDGKYVAHIVGDQLLREVCLDPDIAHVVQAFEQASFHSSMVMKQGSALAKQVFDQLNDLGLCYEDQDVAYEMAIKLHLCQLFLAIYQSTGMSLRTHQIEDKSVHYVKVALTYMDNHYNEKINLSVMGELTHLSAQHFGRVFKQYTGKSFMYYLSLYRLDKAQWYLKNTDLPITQIPEKVGICNPNYMARLFKETYKKTPRQVRRPKGHKTTIE